MCGGSNKIGRREKRLKESWMREKKRKCWECVELDGPGWGDNFKEYLK